MKDSTESKHEEVLKIETWGGEFIYTNIFYLYTTTARDKALLQKGMELERVYPNIKIKSVQTIRAGPIEPYPYTYKVK